MFIILTLHEVVSNTFNVNATRAVWVGKDNFMGAGAVEINLNEYKNPSIDIARSSRVKRYASCRGVYRRGNRGP